MKKLTKREFSYIKCLSNMYVFYNSETNEIFIRAIPHFEGLFLGLDHGSCIVNKNKLISRKELDSDYLIGKF